MIIGLPNTAPFCPTTSKRLRGCCPDHLNTVLPVLLIALPSQAQESTDRSTEGYYIYFRRPFQLEEDSGISSLRKLPRFTVREPNQLTRPATNCTPTQTHARCPVDRGCSHPRGANPQVFAPSPPATPQPSSLPPLSELSCLVMLRLGFACTPSLSLHVDYALAPRGLGSALRTPRSASLCAVP